MKRIVVLAEGAFGPHSSKTAVGLIRFGRFPVVAVIDSTKAGHTADEFIGEIGKGIPIVSDVDEAIRYNPTSLVIGISPVGGQLPDEWRKIIRRAIELGMDIESGLHQFLSEDPEFSKLAEKHGIKLIDYRKVPEKYNRIPDFKDFESFVVLVTGTDSNVGKMTTAVALERAAVRRGLKAVMAPTGQTGIMLEGWGVAIDHVLSDFVAGAVELLIREAERDMGAEIVFVEGQGSLYQPAYSGVALGLMHGSRPDAIVLVHNPNRKRIRHFPQVEIPPIEDVVRHHELVASFVKPSKVVAIALDTSELDEPAAIQKIREVQEKTGLPATDPIRFGADKLIDAVLEFRSKF